MWNKLNSHTLRNGMTTLENCLIVFYKVKHTDLLYDPVIPLLGANLREMETSLAIVQEHFILQTRNNPNVMFNNKWMNK